MNHSLIYIVDEIIILDQSIVDQLNNDKLFL